MTDLDALETAAGQAAADLTIQGDDRYTDPDDYRNQEAVEAEATVRRYGGRCAICNVLRDYHPLEYRTTLIAVHSFVPKRIYRDSIPR